MDNEEDLMSDIKKLLGVKRKPKKSRKEIIDKLYTILNMATSESKSENNTALKKAEQYISYNNILISEIDVEKLYDKDAVMDFIINHYYMKAEKQEEKQKFIEHIMPLTKREEIFQKMAKSVEVYKPQQRQEEPREKACTRAKKPDWTAGQGQPKERVYTRTKEPRMTEEPLEELLEGVEFSNNVNQISLSDIYNLGKIRLRDMVRLQPYYNEDAEHSTNIVENVEYKRSNKIVHAIVYGEIIDDNNHGKEGYEIGLFTGENELIGSLVTNEYGLYRGELAIPRRYLLSQNHSSVKTYIRRYELSRKAIGEAKLYIIKTKLKTNGHENIAMSVFSNKDELIEDMVTLNQYRR